MSLDEKSYIEGSRAAWRQMLAECLSNMDADGDDPQAALARATLHLDETRAALRRLGREIGADDWPEKLHLADVVEKYIGDAIEQADANQADERVLAVVRDRLVPVWAAGGPDVTSKIVNIAGDLVEMCGAPRDPFERKR